MGVTKQKMIERIEKNLKGEKDYSTFWYLVTAALEVKKGLKLDVENYTIEKLTELSFLIKYDEPTLKLLSSLRFFFTTLKKMNNTLIMLDRKIGCSHYLIQTASNYEEFEKMYYSLRDLFDKLEKTISFFPNSFRPYISCENKFEKINGAIYE